MAFFHVLRVALVSAVLLTSVSGKCTHPKVRKEWRSLRADERAAWINAVKCLAKSPHNPKIVPVVDPAISLIPSLNTNSSYYDDFVYIHMDLNVLIHNTGFFLPWHRLFVQTFEDKLRSICGYDGVQPYWDWTQDTADFYHAPIWSNSDYDGLGFWGDPNNDYQITTGGFKDMRLAYPVPHNLRRNYTLYPYFPPGFPLPPDVPPVDPTLMYNTTFTSAVVNATLNSGQGDFVTFQATLENFSGPHPGPHLIFGGDMGGTCPFGTGPPECVPGAKWSVNEPMFFLHHGMIDKIWYDWQHRNSSNKNIFAGGSISWLATSNVSVLQYPTGGPPLLNTSSPIPGDGMWETTTVGDVLDTVGGRLCYTYG